MATVTADSSIGVPGVIDNFANALTINGADNTGTRTDGTTSFPSGGHLNMVDAVLITDQMSFNSTITPTDVSSTLKDSRIHLTHDNGIRNNPWYGTHSFDGATFQTDSELTSVAYFFGGSQPDSNWHMQVNGKGLDLVNYSRSTFVLHTAGLKSVTGNGAISLIGNTFSQASMAVPIYNISPADSADIQSFFGDGTFNGIPYGYSYRMAHQAGVADSVNDIVDGTGGRAALYTDFNLANVVKTGSQAYTTTSVTTVARQSVLQMNHLAVWWMLDPIMANGPGEANDGIDLHVGFHEDNSPGKTRDGIVGNATDAEIRMFIGDRVVGRDAATGDLVDGGYKIRYDAPVRFVPQSWDVDNLPLETVDNDVSFDQDSTDLTDPTPYKGAMVEAYRRRYGLGSTADPSDVNTTLNANQDPGLAGNTFATLPTDIVRTTRHYEFDFPYTSTVQPNYTGGSSGLVTLNERRIDGATIAAYLNGRTALTAPISGVTDYADVYASIRRAYFDTAPLGLMPVTGSGTTLNFDRGILFTSSAPTTYTDDLLTVGISSLPSSITGDNTTFDFGTNNVNWNNHRIPDGITLVGGTQQNLNSTIGNGAYTVAGTISLLLGVPTPQEFVGLDGLLGDITYGAGASVTLTNNVLITVQIDEDDIPSALNYVMGSNSLGNGITRVNAVVDYTVRPQGTIEEIRARGGYWGFKVSGDASGIDVAIISTTTLPQITHTISSGLDRDFIACYKPANVIKDGLTLGLAYEVTSVAYNPSTMTENLSVGAVTFATLLTDLAEDYPSGLVLGTTLPAIVPTGLEAGSMEVTINQDILTSGETLTHAMSVANRLSFFRAHFYNDVTWQLLEIGVNNRTIWNSTSSRPEGETRNFVYFAALQNVGETFPTQKFIRQATIISQSPNGFAQVVPLVEGTASLNQVIAAARSGIETSTVATTIESTAIDIGQVESSLTTVANNVNQTLLATTGISTAVANVDDDLQDVRNGVGYVVSGGSSSKLLGLKPKAVVYTPGTSFIGDL